MYEQEVENIQEKMGHLSNLLKTEGCKKKAEKLLAKVEELKGQAVGVEDGSALR